MRRSVYALNGSWYGGREAAACAEALSTSRGISCDHSGGGGALIVTRPAVASPLFARHPWRRWERCWHTVNISALGARLIVVAHRRRPCNRHLCYRRKVRCRASSRIRYIWKTHASGGCDPCGRRSLSVAWYLNGSACIAYRDQYRDRRRKGIFSAVCDFTLLCMLHPAHIRLLLQHSR